MSAPFLATITLLGGGAQPKGGATHLAMITPLGGGHIDAGLPEGPGWGGPTDPGWGNVGAGPRPDHDLPINPARPDAGLPPGTPVPPETWPPLPPPPLPPHLEEQLIVATHRPGVTEWTVRAYPLPAPKG